MEIPEKFIEIRGLNLRYFQIGKGQDLLLIHGKPGCIEDWEPFFALSNNFRITVFDRTGHGLSDADFDRNNISSNAEIAFSIMTKLQLRDVILIGHSYGGAIALQMAARDASNLKGVLVIGSHSLPQEKIDLTSYPLVLPVIGNWIAKMAGMLAGSLVKQGINTGFHPSEDKIPPGFVEKRLHLWTQGKVLSTLAREEQAIRGDLSTLVSELDKITIKVFIVHGKKDRVINYERSLRLHDALSNSEIALIDDGGHYLQFSSLDTILGGIHSLNEK